MSASLVTEKDPDLLMVKLHGRGVIIVCLGTLLCASTKLLKDKATIMHLSCCLVLKSNTYIYIRSVAQLFVTNYIISKHWSYLLFLGSFMMIAWVMFSSIGIITARFFKDGWEGKTIGGIKVWFQVNNPKKM